MESHDALQVSQPANFVPAIMKLRHRHLLRASLQLVLHIRLRTKAIDVRRDCRIKGGARKDDGEGEPKRHGDMSAHNIRFDEQDHQEEERKSESEGDDCFGILTLGTIPLCVRGTERFRGCVLTRQGFEEGRICSGFVLCQSCFAVNYPASFVTEDLDENGRWVTPQFMSAAELPVCDDVADVGFG
jgi:hypothetical protein